jgi:outer membrane lipoprotein-sorting protein
MHTARMVRLVWFLALALAACPAKPAVRSYPPPAPEVILAHIAGLRERATSLNADTKTDVRMGKARANVTVMMLAAWGGKLRFQALDPQNAMAADLASDGERYCYLDVHAGCAECGAATPENVARLVRIPLEPDEVVAVLLGATPVLAGADASLEWDARGGHEVVTLRRGAEVQRVVLDGRDRRWDVLDSELRRDGESRWRIRHKDFREIKTATGQTVRLPGASIFEEGGDTVRISWRDRRVGEPLDDAKFRMTPPAGLPACP